LLHDWAEQHKVSISPAESEVRIFVSRELENTTCSLPDDRLKEVMSLNQNAEHLDRTLALMEEMTSVLQSQKIRTIYADVNNSPTASRSVEIALAEHRDSIAEKIEQDLQITGSQKIRLGLVDGRLYLWIHDINSSDLINGYGDAFFYFDKNEFSRIISEMKDVLIGDSLKGLHNTVTHVNRVLAQMFPDDSSDSFINIRYYRIKGKYFHYILDVLNKPLSTFEGRIITIAGYNGQGGILNPRFPSGENLELVLSRLAAVVISDCYLSKNGSIEYYESDLDRIGIVQSYLRTLGDIELNPTFDAEKNCYLSIIPNVLGSILIKRGLTPGNKAIHNPTVSTRWNCY
jgi:hypothetical protein